MRTGQRAGMAPRLRWRDPRAADARPSRSRPRAAAAGRLELEAGPGVAGGAVGPAESAAFFCIGDDVSLARGVTFVVLHSEKRLLRTTVYVNSISAKTAGRDLGFSSEQNIALFNLGGQDGSPIGLNRLSTCAGQPRPRCMEKGYVRSEPVRQTRRLNRAMFSNSCGSVTPPATIWRRNRRPRVAPPLAGLSHALSMAPVPLRSKKRRGGQGVGNPTSTSARGDRSSWPPHGDPGRIEMGDVRFRGSVLGPLCRRRRFCPYVRRGVPASVPTRP